MSQQDGSRQLGFLCGNGVCVNSQAQCDGTDHCGDMSDELVCQPGQYILLNLKCI